MGKLILTAGLCLVIASLASASAHLQSYNLVCHFDHTARNRPKYGRFTVSHINPNLCTHLIFASATINNLNKLAYKHAADKHHYYSFNALKHRNPLLKTLLEVGGLKFNRQKFRRMVSSKARRGTFIQSAIKLLRYYGFDGLNVDWRYPRQQDKWRFTLLCKELKEAFVAEGIQTGHDRLIITASVSAVKATIDASYEAAQIATHLDFLNVLTFDFDDSSESVTRHHSPLYQGSQDTGYNTYLNADYAMRYWRDQGASSDKLNLGLATYGQTFELSDSASSNVGAPANGPGQAGTYTRKYGFLAYYEICPFLAGATIQFIADQKVPYATKGNQWVGYDNKYSLVHKVNYIRTNHFGGAFVSSLDLDDFSGYFCKQGNYPFISHLHSLLAPGGPNLCHGKENGLYPNSLDPSTYYVCWNGAGHLEKCPGYMVFRQYCKCCDYPTITPPANPCHGKEYGLYPNYHDKHSYYNCAHGIAHLQYCTANLVFKTSCQCCDYPTNTHTGNPCYGKPNGNIPHPYYPYSYYKCINGKAHLLQCPEYSVYKTSCVYPTSIINPCYGKPSGVYNNLYSEHSYYICEHGKAQLKYCPGNLVFRQSCRCCAHPTTTPTGKTCNGKSNGLYPYSQDKHSYYHCSNGVAYLKRCAADLVFNPSCSCCDYPTSTPTNPCFKVRNGYYPYKHDDTCFYNCAGGIHQLLQCPPNFVYQHSSHSCVYGKITPTGNLCHGKENGLYPNSLDQSTYYNCWNGAGHLEKCPGNMVFRQYCKCCDYPTTTPPANPCHGKEYGLYPNYHDKHSYYNCAHGIAHLQYCTANLVFKTSCQCCDYPTNTHTGNPCYGKPNGNIPHPYYPYSYYKCIKGKAHLLQCPEYSVYKTSCVYPTSIINPCYGKPSGVYNNLYSEHSYYICENGNAQLKYCPANLVFRQSCRCCVHPTTTPTGKTCNGKSNGLYPYSQDKHSFYHCSNGVAFLKRCAADLVFNPSCSCCDYPTSTPTNPCYTVRNGYYPYNHDHTCFYNCAYGIHQLLQCPPNYVYKPSSHSCVYGIATTTGNPCHGKLNGYLPYPQDTHYFYNCASGIAYIQECPPNLVFEASCNCCDHPPAKKH